MEQGARIPVVPDELVSSRGRFLSVLDRLIRFDRAILATLIFRGWNIVAGGVMVVMVGTRLSGVEQGYYYAFASVLGLQIFFELGLNFVIVQFVSHEAAHIQWVGQDISGSQAAIDRVANLLVSIKRWFALVAVGFVLAVGVVGTYFFLYSRDPLPAAEWLPAWLLMCLATGVNLYFSPQLAVVEGLGRIRQVATLRLLQSIAGFLFCWLILLLKYGLLAAPLIPLAAALGTAYWLRRFGGFKVLLLKRHDQHARISWRHEILPMQWRIALSWISGYLLFQLFVPAVFARQGAVAAGQLGLSLSVFGSITNVSVAWISAKVPTLGALISRKQYAVLKTEFEKLLLHSGVANIVISCGFILFVAGLHWLGIPLANRILPVSALVLLALVALANNCSFGMASFMRAHKEEPLLLNSVVSGVIMAVATYFAAASSALTVVVSYVVTTVLISLPWTLVIFRRYWAKSGT